MTTDTEAPPAPSAIAPEDQDIWGIGAHGGTIEQPAPDASAQEPEEPPLAVEAEDPVVDKEKMEAGREQDEDVPSNDLTADPKALEAAYKDMDSYVQQLQEDRNFFEGLKSDPAFDNEAIEAVQGYLTAHTAAQIGDVRKRHGLTDEEFPVNEETIDQQTAPKPDDLENMTPEEQLARLQEIKNSGRYPHMVIQFQALENTLREEIEKGGLSTQEQQAEKEQPQPSVDQKDTNRAEVGAEEKAARPEGIPIKQNQQAKVEEQVQQVTEADAGLEKNEKPKVKMDVSVQNLVNQAANADHKGQIEDPALAEEQVKKVEVQPRSQVSGLKISPEVLQQLIDEGRRTGLGDRLPSHARMETKPMGMEVLQKLEGYAKLGPHNKPQLELATGAGKARGGGPDR